MGVGEWVDGWVGVGGGGGASVGMHYCCSETCTGSTNASKCSVVPYVQVSLMDLRVTVADTTTRSAL